MNESRVTGRKQVSVGFITGDWFGFSVPEQCQLALVFTERILGRIFQTRLGLGRDQGDGEEIKADA